MTRYDWKRLLPLAAELVVEETTAIGVPPTLRRLHYLLVSNEAAREAGYVNTQAAYKALSATTTPLRDAGTFPPLEDRTRNIDRADGWEDLDEALGWMADSFRLDRSGQVPVLLVAEKDGVLGLLESRYWWLPRTALKGYCSQSHRREVDLFDADAILYLGDYDPTGLDIDRNLGDHVDCDIIRIAVTADQVVEHNLVPAPAKATDSRTAAMLASEGVAVQVELDALDRRVLLDLIDAAIVAATGVEVRGDGLPDLPDLDRLEDQMRRQLRELVR